MQLRRLAFLLASSTATVALVASPLAALAQSQSPEGTPLLVPPGSTLTPSGAIASCFDYYKYGSVPVALTSTLATVSSGSTFAVAASIENKNDYPIVGATVYVRVFRQPDGAFKNSNGPDVVDFFPVAKNITLKAHESKNFTFFWKVPVDVDPGAYRMVPFVAQDDRFNLQGLSFTDDITGGPYLFNVVNDAKGGVRFDRSTATLNNQPYRFVAYAPTLAPSVTNVPVSLGIDNTSNKAFIGTVDWKLYSWDGLQESNLLAQGTSKTAIGAHASTTVTYTVTDTSHAVYYLTATLTTPGGSKSIAAMRFVRGGVNTPRIADVGTASYPLAKNGTVFACFHSSGSSRADNVRVEVSISTLPLFGLISLPLANATYTGFAPGNLVALVAHAPFALHSYQVNGKVFQNGKLVDSVSVPYSCSELSGCTDYLTPIVVLTSLLIALLLGWLLVRIRRAHLTRLTVPEHRSLTPPTV